MPNRYLVDKTYDVVFHKSGYRFMLKTLLLLMLLITMTLGYIFYNHLTVVQQPFFATTTNGQLIELFPVFDE